MQIQFRKISITKRLAIGTILLAFIIPVHLHAQQLPSEEAREKQIQALVSITKDQPKDVGSWHDLATLYRYAKRWDNAIQAESKAIEGHPKYAVAYYGRGKARMGKKDYAAARADFTKAIDLWQSRGGLELFLTLEQPKDEHVDSYRSRGMAWANENHFNEGIADVSIAIRLKKQDARLFFERAYLEEKAGQTKAAISDYHTAGLFFQDRGDKKSAEECLQNLQRLKADKEADDLKHHLEEASRKPGDDLPQ